MHSCMAREEGQLAIAAKLPSCGGFLGPGILQLEQTGREFDATIQMTPPCDECDSNQL